MVQPLQSPRRPSASVRVDDQLPTPRGRTMPPPPARTATTTRNDASDSVIASSLVSGQHGRQRRQERGIDKPTLQAARRYGMKEQARFGREMYTYQGVTFIYDPVQNKEITSYLSTRNEPNHHQQQQHDAAGEPAHKKRKVEVTGTRSTVPILLSKRYDYCTPEVLQQHERLRQKVRGSPEKWSSHSILIVDASGSMRADDMNGARCRSDGVWMALARDFVKEQLEESDRSSKQHSSAPKHFDVVSVVLMINDGIQVLLQTEPLDWVLYNRFVDYREWSHIKPAGHGNYLPALDKAEELLNLSADSGACALSVLFFSDGRPSDFWRTTTTINDNSREKTTRIFAERMGRIAAKFGNRLTLQCVGMASAAHDRNEFVILKEMVREAASYGAVAAMGQPKLTQPHALSSSIKSLVSSMTQCKTTLTHPETGRPRRVRTDLLREKMDCREDTALTKDWQAFHAGSHTHYLERVWTWDRQRDDFVYVMDPRCIYCYKLIASSLASEVASSGTTPGSLCPDCKACFICTDCQQNPASHDGYTHTKSLDCETFKEDRRQKAMIQSQNVPSFSVAMKSTVFGEGAERLVRQFRYLDDRNNFVGPKWVAKESRFVEEESEKEDTLKSSPIDYHRDFMRSQMLAHDLAAKFNEALDELPLRFPPTQHEWLKKLPRIRFVEPLVVELVENCTKKTFLVETMLKGRYRKFNNNMGYVNTKSTARLPGLADSMQVGTDGRILDAIVEEEGDDDLGDSGLTVPSMKSSAISDDSRSSGGAKFKNLRIEDFPQAFSHFTYERSKKRLLVVDLQGVLQVNDLDGTCEYLLTDPAIHKRESGTLRLGHFGHTDRGKKGMKAFWKSHVCTEACSLLGLEKQDSR